VTLSGAFGATTTANGSGNYTFSGLVNGSYTVTPSKSGFTFSPTSAPATVSNGNVTAVNFTIAAVPTYSISGTISPAANGAGATVTLTGAGSATTTADASGNYTFTGRANGNYTVTPSKAGFTFSPLNRAVNINSADVGAVDFTATVAPLATTLLADAQVRSANPTRNYGTLTTLRTREGNASNPTTYHSYLKFDVTGLGGSVATAKLRLFATASSSTGILVYSSDSGWTETGINWNNAPLLGVLRGSSGAITQNTWVEITLPTSMFTTNQAYTLVLTGKTSQSAYFNSKEGTNDPQLILRLEP
jgi:hypothetical protein